MGIVYSDKVKLSLVGSRFEFFLFLFNWHIFHQGDAWRMVFSSEDTVKDFLKSCPMVSYLIMNDHYYYSILKGLFQHLY